MRKKFWAVVSAIALIPISVITGAVLEDATPAGADTVTLPLSCLVSPVPVVGSLTTTRNQVITSTTVDHVYQNGTFTVAITPAPGNESSDAGSGATLRYIRDLRYRVQRPRELAAARALDLGWLRLGQWDAEHLVVGLDADGARARSDPAEHELPAPDREHDAARRPARHSRRSNRAWLVPATRTWDLQMVVNADLPSGLGNSDLPTSCFPSSSIALVHDHDLAAGHRGPVGHDQQPP